MIPLNKYGFLLVNKPPGPTSHDIIDQLRKITGIRKIGHAGTLDPFASGLLIVGVGREATKKISRFVKLDKEYLAKLKLGFVSDTFDRTGKITKNEKFKIPSENEVKKVLQNFVGNQTQIPPMYSAKKVGGKKLYKLARAGQEIERQPQKIIIHKISMVDYEFPFLTISVLCSSGTYIRTLTHNIGQKLGTGAYLEKLERTQIGEYQLKDAIKLKDLNNHQDE